MSLASGLREAQIHEIPVFSHCSQLSQDLGGCCIHSGFLGVGQRGEPSVSTHGLMGLGSCFCVVIEIIGMLFEGLFCCDITSLTSEYIFLRVSAWKTFL